MAQEDDHWDDDERYYSPTRDMDDSPLLSQRICEKRRYEEYPPAKEERERRSTLSVVMKFFLFCTAMITFCVLLYIPVYNKANYHMSKALVAGWSTHTNRDTKLYVLPNNVTTIHEPDHICTQTDKNKLFLLIIVCSATDNFEKRLAIRNTWGNYTKYPHIAEIYNKIRDKYKDYNYTYDLYNSTREKRDIASISKLLPALTQALQNKVNKTETVPEENYQDSVFKDFENKEVENEVFDYDYESNIMKIPPRGYEDSPDLDKVMSLLKNDKKFPKIEENLVDSNTEVDFKVVFLLGLPVQRNDSAVQDRIEEEVEMFGDIIQEGFMDTYNNLTLKSIMMLKWINNKCNNSVRYILKTDDDMYINVPNLIWNLRNRSREHDLKASKVKGQTKEYLLIGDLICGARPVLDATNKWYSPRYMYNGRVYPRYLSGTGYLFSADTARVIYRAALTTPYFHLEDIYITGICVLRATPRVVPRDDATFSYSPLPPRAPALPCAAHARASAHQVYPRRMQRLHRLLAEPALVDRCVPPQVYPRRLHRLLAEPALVDRCERMRLTEVRRDRMRPKQQKRTKLSHIH